MSNITSSVLSEQAPINANVETWIVSTLSNKDIFGMVSWAIWGAKDMKIDEDNLSAVAENLSDKISEAISQESGFFSYPFVINKNQDLEFMQDDD